MPLKKQEQVNVPYQVVDLNWEDEIPDLLIDDNYSGILALVRCQRRPVGLVRVSALNGNVSSKKLRRKFQSVIGDPHQWPSYGPKGDSKVSIVVCTRNRPEMLRSCLSGLFPIHQKGHEIVVVDNAPDTDSSYQLVKEYPYKYIVEPRIGLNHARNRGFENSSHNIVAFTDDDCIPEKEWLEALTGPFMDETVWGTTGLVIPFELETVAQDHFEDYCANRRIFYRKFFSSPPTAPSEAGIVGMGANMSFRREILERLGGFDTRFDGGTPTLSGGDTEFFSRVLASGGRIVYRPDALVRHRHVDGDKALQRVIYGYGVGLYAFLMKRLVEEHDLSVLKTAPRWIVGPPIKAVQNRLLRRPAASWNLVFSEFAGSLRGPLIFIVVKNGKMFNWYKKLGV
jgi:glycosyltransferase involved in cell wall biosynthesis